MTEASTVTSSVFAASTVTEGDIQEALEPELLDLWSARDGALAQLCVETATWGLRYWEETPGRFPRRRKRCNPIADGRESAPGWSR